MPLLRCTLVHSHLPPNYILTYAFRTTTVLSKSSSRWRSVFGAFRSSLPRQSPTAMRKVTSQKFSTQSERKTWFIYVDPSAYEVFRVVLHVWDSISTSTTGITADRPQQELSKIRALLGLLASLLKIFEVAVYCLLTGLMSLTAVISSTTVSPPTNDLTIFAR